MIELEHFASRTENKQPFSLWAKPWRGTPPGRQGPPESARPGVSFPAGAAPVAGHGLPSASAGFRHRRAEYIDYLPRQNPALC
jgi:hypothetical protein